MSRYVPHLILLLTLITLSCNNSDKKAPPSPPARDQPLQAAKYSPAFGAALDAMMQTYQQMVTGFVAGDTQKVGTTASQFLRRLDSLPIAEFQKDSLVYQTAVQQQGDTRSEVTGLAGEKTLAGQRQELNMVSQDLYDLLRTIRYAQKKVYFTECGAAFGEEKPGSWIGTTGDTSALVNPFGVAGHCGLIRDSLPGHP